MRGRRHKTASDDHLWAQLRELLEAAGRVKPKPSKAPAGSSARRLKALRRALAAGDLARVRAQVPDEDAGNKAQRVVVYAYACILETNSAGLSILFDRFSRAERRRIASALAAIGAEGALRELNRLERLSARGRERATSRAAKLVAQMEAKLLRFCRAHVEELAAG